MKMVTTALTGIMLTTAVNGAEVGLSGTVNAASESEIVRAKAAISHAGYQPGVLEMAQDHNLFFTATKAGETYEITVTPDRKLYVSTGLPSHGSS